MTLWLKKKMTTTQEPFLFELVSFSLLEATQDNFPFELVSFSVLA